MTTSQNTPAAAADRLSKAFTRLEAAIAKTQAARNSGEDVAALKQARDDYKRQLFLEKERYEKLHAVTFTVSDRLSDVIAQVEAVMAHEQTEG